MSDPKLESLVALVVETVAQATHESSAAEVLDVAVGLRAIVMALPPSTPTEATLASLLVSAAAAIERRSGAL